MIIKITFCIWLVDCYNCCTSISPVLDIILLEFGFVIIKKVVKEMALDLDRQQIFHIFTWLAVNKIDQLTKTAAYLNRCYDPGEPGFFTGAPRRFKCGCTIRISLHNTSKVANCSNTTCRYCAGQKYRDMEYHINFHHI